MRTVILALTLCTLLTASCKKEDIKPESRFMEDLGFTSFDFMSMLGEIEDELDIEVVQEYDAYCERMGYIQRKERMVEVLQNVMENAIKYGDGKSIHIVFGEEEDCKLIHIENSGCSLKEEELSNLFDSFYRGSNSNSVKGSGLGLYICKTLMRKMDGEIFAQIKEESFVVTVVARKA